MSTYATERRAEVACPNEECPVAVSVTLSDDGVRIDTACDCYKEAAARSPQAGWDYLAALEQRARPVAEETF